jgi:hypothetical protein
MSRVEGDRWLVIREALLLIQQLRSGPAGREQLISAVRETLPESFQQNGAKAQQRHFERVLDRCRQQLAVQIDWKPNAKAYELIETGPFLGLQLPPEPLDGLGFLLHLFEESDKMGEQVMPLLAYLKNQLSDEQVISLSRFRPNMRLSLRRLDAGSIPAAVWNKVNRAIQTRRLLRFGYLAPRHADQLPRMHTAEPFNLDFRNGHFYLEAFSREVRHPDGRIGGNHWASYRVDNILAEGIEVLPTIFSKETRSQRLITITYKIAPAIARGNPTYHFEEMVFNEPDKAGWVTVTGKTKSLFDAYRTLLAMGPMCVVLGPEKLVLHMQRMAADINDLYKKEHGPTPPLKNDGSSYIE